MPKKNIESIQGGKINLPTQAVIKRKAKNTIKDIGKVAQKIVPLLPPVVPLVPNKVLVDVATGKRKSGLLPPPVRKILQTIGETQIESVVIVKTPIESMVKTLMNVISLGAFEKAVKDAQYDSMLHLALFINGKYTLDKQAVIKLTTSNPIKSTSSTMDVIVDKDITFNQLLDNARQSMGDSNFTNYDARKNNCQDFVLAVLRGSGLLRDEYVTFVKQDAEAVFRQLPSFTDKLAHAITDVGAIADKVIEGESLKKQTTVWTEFVQKHMKGKTFKSRSARNAYLKELSVKYRKKYKK